VHPEDNHLSLIGCAQSTCLNFLQGELKSCKFFSLQHSIFCGGGNICLLAIHSQFVTVVWEEKRDVLAVGLAVTAYLGSQEGTETGHAMMVEPIPFLGFGCLQWHRGAEGRLRGTCKFAISSRKGNTTGCHIYRPYAVPWGRHFPE
jgi:hypothetical protein